MAKANTLHNGLSPWAGLPMVALFIVPVLGSLGLILPLFADVSAVWAMLAHPQFFGGLALSMFTGITSTALALVVAIFVVKAHSKNLSRDAGLFLAFPHIALALGLAFMIVPTGIIARVIALLITGWTLPPQWVAVQDPLGLSLTAALVLKEAPFLVWAIASILNRDDIKLSLAQHSRIAASLGHSPGSVWFRIVLPQILPRIIWPVVAVFTYGMSVVDMALIIGPTQPPTLATIIWRDLNDGEALANARGAAGVLILSAVIFAVLSALWVLLKSTKALRHKFYAGHPQVQAWTFNSGGYIWNFCRGFYIVLTLILLVQSISGYWPFPNLMADKFTLKAWATALVESGPLLTTLLHATLSSTIAVAITVLWFESQNLSRDYILSWVCGFSLCLPALLLGIGQYRLFLLFEITGSYVALFLAHLLPTTAYVFIMLQGPYRGFDPRWKRASNGLTIQFWDYLIGVKLPMLKSALFSALAVGFAVAVAQFVGVQLAASGRHATLAMEAVTLTSGGNRPLIATYALMLMILPLAVYFLAAVLGRPRWSTV